MFWPDARWSFGLVVAALLTGLAYVHGRFLEHVDVLLAPVLIAGLATTFAYGFRRSGNAGVRLRLTAGTAAAAVYLLIAAAPAGVRWALVRAEASRLPMPKDAVVDRWDVHPLPVMRATYRSYDYWLAFETVEPSDLLVVRFYQELSADGWTLLRRRIGSDESFLRFVRAGVDLSVTIRGPGSERRRSYVDIQCAGPVLRRPRWVEDW